MYAKDIIIITMPMQRIVKKLKGVSNKYPEINTAKDPKTKL